LEKIDWIRGDALGLEVPTHALALLEGGADWLTRAFRTSGVLAADNRVERITAYTEITGGSTGRKLALNVAYARPDPGLHELLFVKFSRDFDDEMRDRACVQMALEVRFALLSLDPRFPIAVPRCYFSDYHEPSGSGVLITQQIPFGVAPVEPQYPKCLDYRMPDAPGHYRAIMRALGRLAGTHRAGGLADTVETHFPFDPSALSVSRRGAYTPEQIAERVTAYAAFAQECPSLLPDELRSAGFIARLADEAPRFQALESAVPTLLRSRPDLIALCHWNAHVDNAWFWRDASGELQCGLLDWGNVSQMNLAMPVWGCLSAAEPSIWHDHLDALLQVFAAAYEDAGAPALDMAALRLHLLAYVGMMGLAWMLDAPALIRRHVPDVALAQGRFDPRIEGSERARSQLLIMTSFLELWSQSDMQSVIDALQAQQQADR